MPYESEQERNRAMDRIDTLRDNNALLVSALEETLRQNDRLKRTPTDYCLKWINSPLDPCDCDICRIKDVLAKVRRSEMKDYSKNSVEYFCPVCNENHISKPCESPTG